MNLPTIVFIDVDDTDVNLFIRPYFFVTPRANEIVRYNNVQYRVRSVEHCFESYGQVINVYVEAWHLGVTT